MILDGVKIDFGLLVDKTIGTDTITATATGQQSDFSNVYDTLNSDEKQKIAYLEDDYWLLDGSFVMPTDDDIAGSGSVQNVAGDPSFESTVWSSSRNTDLTYSNRWTVSVQRSSAHAKEGSYSYLFNFSYSGGSAYSSANFATATATILDNSTSLREGHKYYIKAFVYEEGNAGSYGGDYYIVDLTSSATTASRSVGRVSSKVSAQGGDWRYISNVLSVTNQDLYGKVLLGRNVSFIAGYNRQDNYRMWIDDLLIVDLTEKYGTGREPSVEVCDRIFDGGKTISIGYESNNVSLSSEELTYSFGNLHDSYGLTLKFPPTSIPSSCNVSYYKNSSRIGTVTMFFSDEEDVYKDEHTMLQWNRVVIQLSNLSSLGKRIRMQQITFGINDSYTEDELIKVSANKTVSTISDYFENGELSFSFFNDGRYDIQTIKDLSQKVFEELKTQVYVKRHLQSSYELWGTYYVESGKVEENGHIVSFTAYDGLYRLDDIIFTDGQVYPEGKSLADWARTVASFANVQIDISSTFETIISTGYIAEVPCREAFRLIAEAGNGIFGIDENDVLHLWTYDDKVAYKSGITDDEIVDKSFSLENKNKVMGVRVKQYSFTKGEAPTEIGKVEGAVLTSTGEKMVVELSDAPVDPETVEVNAISGQVDNIQIFSNRVSFVLFGTDGENGNVSITGIPYTVVESVVEKGETKKNVKEISDNYLITAGMGDDVASFQNLHAVKKYDYSAEILKNEYVNVGDLYDMRDNRIVVTNDGFSISYDDYSEDIQGVDE